ncbi:MAG TPA: DUF4838 domain-containing protein [Candidatus Paceibacterota bacterium]|nr:DUF4838 domain-containing protein [Verrucomicrobiota bacterium]HRZ47460.1 DUF4838 domain-containing protein [Candidatus Paceibacterota bacterium]HRZ94485.1 DUF4838 domain-containing protein [Candidatus Paceibacterota bacterium]
MHRPLSDRYVRFYSEVAAIVAREVPGRSLDAYAYSVYRLPPLREKLHPNVILGFVGFSYLNESYREQSREAWQRWSEMASRMLLRRPEDPPPGGLSPKGPSGFVAPHLESHWPAALALREEPGQGIADLKASAEPSGTFCYTFFKAVAVKKR